MLTTEPHPAQHCAWQVASSAQQVWLVRQPQLPGVPPPPQLSGAVQVPQGMVPPQPSEAVPQVCPVGQAVALVQQLPWSQVWPLPQLAAVQTQVPLPLHSGVVPLHVEVQVWLVQVRHWFASQSPLPQQLPLTH